MSYKLGVGLAILNQKGICVDITNSDMDSVNIVSTMSHQNPQKALDTAIKKLEGVIEKMKKLKLQEKPLNASVQEKINGFK